MFAFIYLFCKTNPTLFFVLYSPTYILLLLQGEKKKKKKTITEKYWDWELANETKPIWVS